MEKHKFKHVKVRLQPDQCDDLKLLAAYLGKPIACLMRQIVDTFLSANEIALSQAKARLVCINGYTFTAKSQEHIVGQSKEDAIYEKLDKIMKWITEQ